MTNSRRIQSIENCRLRHFVFRSVRKKTQVKPAVVAAELVLLRRRSDAPIEAVATIAMVVLFNRQRAEALVPDTGAERQEGEVGQHGED